jgi:prepilin signal peptidase PulO-like enzyme (type II secretory pathway)
VVGIRNVSGNSPCATWHHDGGAELMLDRVPIAIVFGLVGWGLGWASAWVSDWLMAKDDLPSPGRGLLIRDPLVQGGSALVWAATPFVLPGDWIRWAETGLVAVPLIQVAVTDFRTRYVYTVMAAIGAAIGLAFGWQVHGFDMPWWTSLAGAVGGFLAFGFLWLLGRLIYRGRVEAMARGDITIAAMVGAGAAGCTPTALFLGVLLGGLIAVALLFARRSRHATMPYGPGLCLGGLAALFWC